MKTVVPLGKTVYSGRDVFREGDSLPEKKTADLSADKSAGKKKEPGKPSGNLSGTPEGPELAAL